MSRLAPAGLIAMLVASPALGQQAIGQDGWRVSGHSQQLETNWDVRAQSVLAPNSRFGFGVFGIRSERAHQLPVTARELATPKSRRAGVGFSLKF